MTDVRKVSSSCLRYYTNISSQYIWYTQYINETPFCNIQPVDSSRLSRLDHTIRSNLHHRSGINLSLRDIEVYILGTTYTQHAHARATTELTSYVFCMNEDEVWRKQIYIVLRGNWDGGSLHACHCEPNVSMHNTHITNENWGWYSFSFLHTTINHWTTLRNLHGDICLNYIMSGRYDKVHFCNVAEQITLHTTINLTPTLSVRWDEMRDRWWITEIKFVPWIMIMTEHHRSIVYFYRSMYVGWRKDRTQYCE